MIAGWFGEHGELYFDIELITALRSIMIMATIYSTLS